jgi:hypothetical protein
MANQRLLWQPPLKEGVKMHVRWKAILDIASTLGAITLFGAWVFQQTLVNKADAALQTIDSAEAKFETYQSNNALFNALCAVEPSATSEIRRFQTINYAFALGHLEEALSPEEQAQLPAAARPFDGDWNANKAISQTQARIDAIQPMLKRKKDDITARSLWVNETFLALYAVGSLFILATSICKTFLPKE